MKKTLIGVGAALAASTTIILAPAAYADGTPDYDGYLKAVHSILGPYNSDNSKYYDHKELWDGQLLCSKLRDGKSPEEVAYELNRHPTSEESGWGLGIVHAAQTYICPDTKRGPP